MKIRVVQKYKTFDFIISTKVITKVKRYSSYLKPVSMARNCDSLTKLEIECPLQLRSDSASNV
jgi:hypothetical protein